ncbi:MAG: putative HAD superfamily protein, partial [Shewanella sp.]
MEEETNLVSKFVQENFETKDMVSNQSSAKKGLLISNMWAKWQESWEELSDKETKGRIRYMDILIHLFGQQSICSITAKEADQVMKTVDMMPKSNIKPYSQWSQTER